MTDCAFKLSMADLPLGNQEPASEHGPFDVTFGCCYMGYFAGVTIVVSPFLEVLGMSISVNPPGSNSISNPDMCLLSMCLLSIFN